jgi:hypothetical protein
MDKVAVLEPSGQLVRLARDEFDSENRVTELALDSLFRTYPSNTVDWQVLLKVVALNRLYWTNILDVHGMTSRMCGAGAEIDAALAAGAPEIVDRIASFGNGRKEWSFATKYCSWHCPEAYPIWDSRVRGYLLKLRRQTRHVFLGTNPELWSKYEEFRRIITDLRDHYNLGNVSVKDLDKFLYRHGKESDRGAKAPAAGELG